MARKKQSKMKYAVYQYEKGKKNYHGISFRKTKADAEKAKKWWKKLKPTERVIIRKRYKK
jgi:hypothetical protein|tara:strand:- start:61 stop:240 length:180 start_codon:yes stop_codon:yes gene_type:complete